MSSSFAEAAFVGITRVEGADAHRRYNEWHQLDHRPENLLLQGVAWGERWVRAPDCVPTVAEGPWHDFHYLNSYWLRPPAAESVAEWASLADRSLQWGRRPDVTIAQRPFMSFFRPVLGLAARRVLVSPEALVLRPTLGVHLTVLRADDDHRSRASVQEAAAWYAQVGFPSLVERHGVAGVWALSGAPELVPDDWARRESGSTDRGALERLRIHLVFCDADPVEVHESLTEGGLPGVLHAPVLADEVLFCGPLRAIRPWDWDWFDERGS